MNGKTLRGRVISGGTASGEALVSKDAISFFGGVNHDGVVVENKHALEGKSIVGRILVLPSLKGSAAGMWILYRLAQNDRAPKAIVVTEADAILAAGAIFGEIPAMDHFDEDPVRCIQTGDSVTVDTTKGTVTIA